MTVYGGRRMTTQGTTRRWVGGSEREPHTRFRCLNLLDEHPFGKGKKPGGIHDNLTSPTSRQGGGFLSKELYHSLSSEESGAQPAADTQKPQKPLVNCEASLELKKGRKSARLGQPVRCTKSVPEPRFTSKGEFCGQELCPVTLQPVER